MYIYIILHGTKKKTTQVFIYTHPQTIHPPQSSNI